MATVSKTIDIKAAVSDVFTYFARPEHIADQFEERVGMTVVPMDVKAGMGVGTTFRVIGDFDGKRLEWDCETTEFIQGERIAAKMIKGPFKRWDIAMEFKQVEAKLTRLGMTVNYPFRRSLNRCGAATRMPPCTGWPRCCWLEKIRASSC